MNIPFLSFDSTNSLIKTEILQAFEKVYDSKWYILGECVKQFEKEYAIFNKVNYCVAVSNGLDALIISLKALNVGAGDEVIIPSNTFIATALAVSHTGAKPVFAEPDYETYNITHEAISAVVSSKTKAVIPVHLYGQSCQMITIMECAKQLDLFVVEDNAQAHGATCVNKITGSWGHINSTSFYPGKNLGALGDGGAVTTDSAEYAQYILSLRNYGSTIKYHHVDIGYNARLDEIQAAFLSIKLKYLQQWTVQRQKAAAWYHSMLAGCMDIILPVTDEYCTHVYHLFVIRTKKRDQLQVYLQNNGINTLIHYPVPVHLQKAYQHLGFKTGDYPVAEELANTSLSLPIYPGITEQQVEYVSNCICNFFK